MIFLSKIWNNVLPAARTIKKGCAAVFYLCVLGLLCISCTHLTKPDKIASSSQEYLDWEKNPPAATDRARHTIKGKRPFEWWYFDGHLDSGETFVGVYLDPSFTTGKPGVAFSIYSPDWEKQSRLLTLEEKEIKTSKEDVDIVSSVGFIHRIDDKTYQVRWDMDDIKADLKLTTLAPGWMPHGGDGVNEDNLDFFWTIHQARNRIEGTITKDGITTQVTGIGYADHNWGRKPLNEITRKWVWGRILAGDYTIVYADVDYLDPAINSRPLYIARGDSILVGSGSPTVTQNDFVTHPRLKRHYPRKVSIDFKEAGVEAHINITYKALVEEVDLLTVSDLNWFVQWIARTFVARPVYFRIIADFEGTITENGVEDSIAGECLYEIMGFE
jgi:hypothetical protein